MPENFSFDVFLSHSAKDKAVVRPLAERLRADGLKVWFDEWVLKPRIFESRVTNHSFSQPGMSANALGSDWAQLLTHPQPSTLDPQPTGDPLNQERRFIPLRLNDAPIKGSLAQLLYINWLPASPEQPASDNNPPVLKAGTICAASDEERNLK